MPLTIPDGLPFEALTDEPTRTLNGGSDGLSDILAIKTQQAISGLRTTVTDVDDRLTTVEGFGTPSWVQIASGSESNVATFVISNIPTGVFRAVRLTLWGLNATSGGAIRARFNSDNTADLHHYGLVVWDALGNVDVADFNNAHTFWDFAWWGGGEANTAIMEIMNTHVSTQCGFQSWGSRLGSGASTMNVSRGWGRINHNRLLDSLRISGPAGDDFSATWWLEGSPA